MLLTWTSMKGWSRPSTNDETKCTRKCRAMICQELTPGWTPSGHPAFQAGVLRRHLGLALPEMMEKKTLELSWLLPDELRQRIDSEDN